MKQTKITTFEKDFILDTLITIYHLNGTILSNENQHPTDEKNNFLQQIHFFSEDTHALFPRLSQQIDEQTLYFFYEKFYLNFCTLKFPHEDEFLFLGPYLSEEVQKNQIEQLLAGQEQLRSSVNDLTFFYQQLPVISDVNMTTYMNQVAKFCYHAQETYQVKRIRRYLIKDTQKKALLLQNEFREPEISALQLIEERYQLENKLLQAVAVGDKRNAINYLGEFDLKMEQIYERNLDERRNRLVIFNTLLRKTMERSSINPYYIDRLSRNSAREIKNINSIIDAENLQIDLVRAYCDLVRQYSFPNYSPIVRDTINLITIYSSKKFSLKELAAKLQINPSYLSQTFKKETGQTISAFTLEQKMKIAAQLLIESNYLIQEIAFSIGIIDVNRFSKMFKKALGITPTEYRKKYRNF